MNKDRPRFRRPGFALVLGGAALVGVVLTHCVSGLPANIHVWGVFASVRTRLGDTCRAVDGGCFPDSNNATMTLGYQTDDGQAVLLRGADPAMRVTGQQAGTRF